MTSRAPITARLEALPATRGFWWRITLLSLGGFFEFYDMFLTAYVAPGLVRAGILSHDGAGMFGGVAGFVASFFAGLFVGTALFGFVADRLGRRAIFTFSLLWYAVCATVMAFQHDAFHLDLWRFAGGIGIGIELVTIDTYIAELAPPRARGRAFAYANVVQFLSIPLVALLAYLLVPRSLFGLDGWRVVVLVGAAGAVVVWWVRTVVPESPRWLAQHGRSEEADRIVSAWEVEARMEGATLGEPQSGADSHASQDGKGSLRDVLRPPYRGRALMLIAFNLFQAAGYYGFASWVPTLLISQGIAVTTSLGYTFVIAIAAPFGPLLGLLFTDRIERKWIIVGAALAIAASGLAFTQAHSAVAVIVCGVALTLANNTLSFAYHGYQPELFPTRIRAAAVGLVYSFSRVSTMFSAFVIAFVLREAGAPGVFVFIAGCMAVVALVIGLFGPRTQGLSLETIFKLNYRHAYHAGNFADVVKHVALVAILLHLRKKETPFAVIDSHAGRGLYDLADAAAEATGEARDGIGRLGGLKPQLPEALDTYLDLVAQAGAQRYPGSPLIAAKLLRPQDRLVAIEKHPEEVAVLSNILAPFAKAIVEAGDGYARLLKLLPPRERRGLVLIDPPFESPDEFRTLAQTARDAFRRFATGIFLIWYPVKSPGAAKGFCGEVLAGGIAKALRIEIAVAPQPGEKLGRSGLLVLNPPYGFDGAMEEILGLLAPLLGQGAPAEAQLEWLTGR